MESPKISDTHNVALDSSAMNPQSGQSDQTTDLLEQNEKLQSILENITDAYFELDAQFTVVYINNTALKSFHLTREAILGKNLWEVFPDAVDTIFYTEYNRAWREGIHVKFESFYPPLGNWFEVHACPMSTGLSVYFHEITERIENELTLKEARANAESANRAKSEFLANMSHEIRTPLNGVQGYLQLLQFTQLDEEQREFVDNAIESSENLITIIDDILDLSKIEAGKIVINESIFKLNSLFRSLHTLFDNKIREKALQLEIRKSDDVPEELIGDVSRIRQVLVNLISNAIKFTDSGTVVTEVNFIESPSPDRITLEFLVRDTGIGMPADVIESIYEPFRQLDNSRKRKYEGTGLGLSIVRRLVEMMNGEIDIQSEENEGTVCSVKLKLGKVRQTETAKVDRMAAQQDADEPDRKKSLHVLVAEDDEYNTIVITRLLKLLGHTCDVAPNGVVVLEMIKMHEFDLILMDLQMPKLDGFSTTIRIRTDPEFADQSSIAIAALTAHAMNQHKQKCREVGMNDFVAKPIDIQGFKKVLDAFC